MYLWYNGKHFFPKTNIHYFFEYKVLYVFFNFQISSYVMYITNSLMLKHKIFIEAVDNSNPSTCAGCTQSSHWEQ